MLHKIVCFKFLGYYRKVCFHRGKGEQEAPAGVFFVIHCRVSLAVCSLPRPFS